MPNRQLSSEERARFLPLDAAELQDPERGLHNLVCATPSAAGGTSGVPSGAVPYVHTLAHLYPNRTGARSAEQA